MKYRVALVWLLLALLSSCGQFEQRAEYVYEGYQGKAIFNRLYAAEQLLQHLDIAVESVRSLSEPPSVGFNDTVILSTPSYTLSADKAQQWIDWVNEGGYLIFALPTHLAPVQDKNDHLLEILGIASDETETRQKLSITLTDDPLDVYFNTNRSLLDETDRADWAFQHEGQTEILYYRIGDGSITVLSDLKMLKNNNIGDHDHADFFWQLIQLNGVPEKVWLQYMPQIPSFFALLWHYAWPVFCALAITLIVLIWAANRRFGPRLLPTASKQRSLLDHIRASGHFYWRHNNAAELLTATRQHILKYWHSHNATANAKEMKQLLTEKSGLSDKQIAAALDPQSVKSAYDFYRTVKSLQQIRKNL